LKMRNELRQQVGLVGANGFIGSNILRALLSAGIQPRLLYGPGARSLRIYEQASFLTCDLTDKQQLDTWASGLDLVIHAAGPPSVRASFEDPEEYVRVHVQGTTTLLNACQQHGVRRLIYISSAEVYGRPEGLPVRESHRLQARSPYSAAKIAAEKMIEAYANSLGLMPVILRPFSIYGPDPIPGSLLATILATARRGRVKLADLRPIRDYCYVEDLASAVLCAMLLNSADIEVFNIGTGRGTSVADLVEIVLHEMNVRVPVLEEPAPMRPAESEIFELVADASRARTVLGWNPAIQLEEGIRRVLQHAAEK
jgi:nucleoside-diphosphate-sugar epimerase